MACNPFFVHFLCAWSEAIQGVIQDSDCLYFVAGSKMDIAEGHGKGFVAQEFFDRSQISPGHNQVRAKGVTGIVKFEVFDLGSPAS